MSISKSKTAASASSGTVTKSQASKLSKAGTKPAAYTKPTGSAPKPATAPTSAMSSGAASPTVMDGPKSVIMGPVMRKKELIDAVVTRSGMKKKDAKPVVESMLAVLGEALADNRELNLPPFGRVKIRKERQLPNGRMMVIKLRQNSPPAHSDAATSSDDDI